jgi:predicted  nucleic acid-binding Zn-ribbon protein
MTQYHYDRPPTTAVEAADQRNAAHRDELQHLMQQLKNRVNQQDNDLRDLQRMMKKLQNEIRTAVSAFNLTRHG